MAALWFDLFLVGWVLLMLLIVVWGWYRGDFGRRYAHVFTGMFLAFLPMLGSSLVGSLGLTGRSQTLARVGLLAVGLAGLAIALRGIRLDEGEDDGDDGNGGPPTGPGTDPDA